MNNILSTQLIPKKMRINSNINKKIRIILSLCSIVLYCLINKTDNILNKTYLQNGKCFLDTGYILSKPLNNLLITNSIFYHFCAIIGSILLDLVFVLGIVSWILYDKYWTALITVIFFYGTRGFLQSIYRNIVPKNEGWIWYYPKFPSISVNYYEANDFFFSGHVGICVLNAFLALYRKHYIFCVFCFISCLLEGILVLITRTHYTIDIPIGFFFGHYSCIIITYWVHFFAGENNNLYEEEKERILEKSKDLETIE